MTLPLRNLFFWIHLVAGLIAAVFIALMSLTGVVLVFEEPVVAWAERGAMDVAPPTPDAQPLPVAEWLEKVKVEHPEKRVSGVTLEKGRVARVEFGRDDTVYVDPYTAKVRPPPPTTAEDFFTWNIRLHRWLLLEDEARPIGKGLHGAATIVFLFLALSGVYLWWPKKWSKAAVRAVLLFRGGLKGKARDFNWHNVIGFWTSLVLVVLCVSGIVISYKWASNLVFTLNGEEPPAGGRRMAAIPVEAPEPGAEPVSFETLLSTVTAKEPGWHVVSVRVDRGGKESKGQSASATVREENPWPPFVAKQFALNPFTADVLKVDTYEDMSAGRKWRTWLRFLHTGEALGPAGQAVAGTASLGGVFLVYTGISLSVRRYWRWRRRRIEEKQKAQAARTTSDALGADAGRTTSLAS